MGNVSWELVRAVEIQMLGCCVDRLTHAPKKYTMLTTTRDRTSPVGYKLSRIAFSNGEPVEPSNSTTALADVFANANNSVCPNNCFRPVGMAIDSVGRIFVSSDATGEIYVLIRDGETAAANHTSSASGTSGPTSSSTGAQATASSAASKLGVSSFVVYSAVLFCLIECFA